jgi:uncharacterized CHY-type Zn-finger protein
MPFFAKNICQDRLGTHTHTHTGKAETRGVFCRCGVVKETLVMVEEASPELLA